MLQQIFGDRYRQFGLLTPFRLFTAASGRTVRRAMPARLLILVLAAAVCVPSWAASPAARITQFEGTVEVSNDGSRWRAVKRSTLLAEGAFVRTGSGATATLVESADTGRQWQLGGMSIVQLTREGPKLQPGTLSRPTTNSGLAVFWDAMVRKFERHQRWASVRRNLTPVYEVEIADEVVLSDAWPDLVWQNAGSEYSYRLLIADREQSVSPAAAGADFVRFRLPLLASGQHEYEVQVLDRDGNRVNENSASGTVIWLSNEQHETLQNRLDALWDDSTTTDYDIGDFMLEQGLLVPAADHFRRMLRENPSDPLAQLALIRTYGELRLAQLRSKQSLVYQNRAAP